MVKTKKILLMDLWTDANRGDAALQESLIGLVRERFPSAEVVGLYRFGRNEFPAAAEETALTRKLLDRSLGGGRLTWLTGDMPRWQRCRFGGLVANAFTMGLLFLDTAIYLIGKALLRRPLSTVKLQFLREIDSADLIVWKGKNFREYGNGTTFTRALSLSINVLPALLMGKRVILTNASFWNITHPLARLYYKFLLGRCEFVIVRDPQSFEHVKKLHGRHPRLTQAPDLSFRVCEKYIRHHTVPPLPLRGNTAALTVTDWGQGKIRDSYVDTLVKAAIHLRSLGIKEIIVVPQVTRKRETNADTLHAIVTRARARAGAALTIMEGAPSVEELIHTYARCRLLVGTRMHSCVFARAAGTPFIAIAYDEGAKWSILSEFWPEDFINNLSTLSANSIQQQLTTLIESGQTLIKNSQPLFDRLIARSNENLPNKIGLAP